MADFNLTKSAQAVDDTLNLIDETIPKLDDSFQTGSGALVNQTIDAAKAGNIGVTSNAVADLDNEVVSGFVYAGGGTLNAPDALGWGVIVSAIDSTTGSKQIAFSTARDDVRFRRQASGVWQPWQEIYHQNGNGVSAADAAIAIKGAKDGNIGIVLQPQESTAGLESGIFRVSAGGSPSGSASGVLTLSGNVGVTAQMSISYDGTRVHFRGQTAGAFGTWQELYHTGNTGVLSFTNSTPTPGSDVVYIGDTAGIIGLSRSGTATTNLMTFNNNNGVVGSIATSGTATSYNTSSDNRLKIDLGKPTDAEIEAKFSDIYDTFTCFNWKTDQDGQKVWGFFAHDVLDKGLDFASEGEGPRDLNIGDVYETIPEVTEEKPILDEEGNDTGETETVVVKEKIEKRVTPAGVDQSKVVPYLVAKIEQLERRIKQLEGL